MALGKRLNFPPPTAAAVVAAAAAAVVRRGGGLPSWNWNGVFLVVPVVMVVVETLLMWALIEGRAPANLLTMAT